MGFVNSLSLSRLLLLLRKEKNRDFSASEASRTPEILMYAYCSLQGLRNPMWCMLGVEVELDPEAQ